MMGFLNSEKNPDKLKLHEASSSKTVNIFDLTSVDKETQETSSSKRFGSACFTISVIVLAVVTGSGLVMMIIFCFRGPFKLRYPGATDPYFTVTTLDHQLTDLKHEEEWFKQMG